MTPIDPLRPYLKSNLMNEVPDGWNWVRYQTRRYTAAVYKYDDFIKSFSNVLLDMIHKNNTVFITVANICCKFNAILQGFTALLDSPRDAVKSVTGSATVWHVFWTPSSVIIGALKIRRLRSQGLQEMQLTINKTFLKRNVRIKELNYGKNLTFDHSEF